MSLCLAGHEANSQVPGLHDRFGSRTCLEASQTAAAVAETAPTTPEQVCNDSASLVAGRKTRQHKSKKKKLTKASNGQARKLTASGSKKTAQGKKRKGKSRKCFKCGKPGHIAKNCCQGECFDC